MPRSRSASRASPIGCIGRGEPLTIARRSRGSSPEIVPAGHDSGAHIREDAPGSRQVPFGEAFVFWLKLGVINFGGPTGQIAVMHHELVDRRRWISNDRFLHALNYCMLLPGPEAQQLAIYIGWLLNRTLGGVIAGVLFVLPGFASILGLSILYAGFHESSLVNAVFYGLKPAVVAVVVEAVVRI